MNTTRLLLSLMALNFLVACQNTALTAGKLSPPSKLHPDAVVQVFAARTKGAKQALAVHTWISTKRSNADHYVSYEVIGWRLKRTGSALVIRQGKPDRDWWGHQPELLLDKRGPELDAVIDAIEAAVADYPYAAEYRAYPGPNSNTFTAFIAREVPALGLDLPATAIGKDYRENIAGITPSGTGVQFNFWGLLGLSAGYEEGLELNLFGLNFELDIFDLAVELPGIGRIGRSAANQEQVIRDNAALDGKGNSIATESETSASTKSPPND